MSIAVLVLPLRLLLKIRAIKVAYLTLLVWAHRVRQQMEGCDVLLIIFAANIYNFGLVPTVVGV